LVVKNSHSSWHSFRGEGHTNATSTELDDIG
jgi:hypothetical protein